MPLKDLVPCIKFVGTLAIPIMYFVSFGNQAWVTTNDTQWGLWGWCYTNFSEDQDPANHVDDTRRCHSISPGDSPGYYEAVRTFACFTLVIHIGYFCTFNEKGCMGEGKKPIILAFVAMSGVVTTVAILGSNYEDDTRWKNLNPSLGWCFWLVTACAILSVIMMCVYYKFDDWSKGTCCSSSVSQSLPPPSARRSSNASTLTLDKGRKITIFRTTEIGGASIHGAQSSAARTSWGAGASASAEPWSGPRGMGPDSRGEQFPVLSVPRYDIAPEPGRIPTFSPPSYEDVTRGGALSPPPVYTVTPFGGEKTE